MSNETYRVIQWATGTVGKVALRHFINSPTFELAGVLVFTDEKVGKDAGEIAGTGPTGVLATDDVDAILALDADCVYFSPIWPDVDSMCRILRSGKNVVSPSGPWYPCEQNRADFDKIEAACREGGTSYHGGGIHPGYANGILPLTLARLMDKIDTVHVYEITNFGEFPSKYIEWMGMGRESAEILRGESLLGASWIYYAEHMAFVVEGLGKKIDKLTQDVEVATAKKDIPYAGIASTDIADLHGVVEKGSVAGQHHSFTAWVDNKPLMVIHAVYTMGDDDLEPQWNWGSTRYKVAIEGDPPTELELLGGNFGSGGRHEHAGYIWTAMDPLNTLPDVVKAPPGILTDFEVGPRLQGQVW